MGGSRLGVVGSSSGRRLGVVCESSGSRLRVVWESSGSRLGVVWESSGSRVGVVWGHQADRLARQRPGSVHSRPSPSTAARLAPQETSSLTQRWGPHPHLTPVAFPSDGGQFHLCVCVCVCVCACWVGEGSPPTGSPSFHA